MKLPFIIELSQRLSNYFLSLFSPSIRFPNFLIPSLFDPPFLGSFFTRLSIKRFLLTDHVAVHLQLPTDYIPTPDNIVPLLDRINDLILGQPFVIFWFSRPETSPDYFKIGSLVDLVASAIPSVPNKNCTSRANSSLLKFRDL